MKKLIVALLTLSSVAALASPALSVPVEILLQTGGDDLREGSYANFYIKLQGRPLIPRNNITRRQNLANNSLTRRTTDIPELTSLNQVELLYNLMVVGARHPQYFAFVNNIEGAVPLRLIISN